MDTYRLNLRQRRRADGAFRIHNADAYYIRLKTQITRIHGVLIEYLINCLSWRRLLESYEAYIKPLICMKESPGCNPS
ncbi:hypothetical protein ACVSMR_05640 [Pseudomonas aeruginosa]